MLSSMDYTAALDKGKRFPELASIDATCKTNDEERPFVKVTGMDGDGKLFSRANALLWDESEEAFMFLLDTALPALWGRETCANTSAIISDGDPHECRAIDRVICQGCFTNAVRRACFWHAVC